MSKDAVSNLIVSNLWHRYSQSWAVQDVSFEVHTSGIIGLLGSNGAGKSTTMNSICGVIFPSRGKIEIGGYDIRRDPIGAKKLLGFLPQKPPLYPDFTVDEFLRYAAFLRDVGPKKVKTVVDAAKQMCGLEDRSKQLIGTLSGGYRQRVGLAQAILHDPKIVILDEPTVGLDPNQIIALRDLIKSIAEDRTIIFSSHILQDVESVCSEIMMIERGKLAYHGGIDGFKALAGTRALEATFGNPPRREGLAQIEGVQSIEYVSETKVAIQSEDPVSLGQRIMARALSQGWELREIYFVRSTLENVFARLSEQSAGHNKSTDQESC